jgi:hypothetical protein
LVYNAVDAWVQRAKNQRKDAWERAATSNSDRPPNPVICAHNFCAGSSMRKSLIVLATAAGIALAATLATDPLLSSGVDEAAHAVIGGVILGSNAWPSAPVDVQSRLLLWSADCKEQGQCGVMAAELASE